ncbi:MAG: hypothetical protein RMM31_05395 [Anaerolineae bacterium]|nr:hypothetical protein [Thermoflexales bacterium]MDW8395662.1 hypothetical protein [Anaerolineae bacterium]
MGEADNVCKFLVKRSPDAFVRFLLEPKEEFTVDVLSEELPAHPLRADSLLRVRRDDSPVVVHIEFQTDFKPDVPWRMLHYFARLYKLYHQEGLIQQVVVVLRRSSVAEEFVYPPERPLTRHRFRVIKLWEINGLELCAYQPLIPLAVLADWGERDALQSVREQLEASREGAAEKSGSGFADEVFCTATLARLKFSKQEVERFLPERVMRESPLYREILDRGKAEGKAEAILEVLSDRFASSFTPISEEVSAKLAILQDLEALDRLFKVALQAQTLDEFIQVLRSLEAEKPRVRKPVTSRGGQLTKPKHGKGLSL